MHCHDSFFVGAMSAAINVSSGLHAMADDLTSAMFALGSQRVNGAFETIEIMRYPIHHDFNRLVILVSTNFARIHYSSLVHLVIAGPGGRPRASRGSSDHALRLRRPPRPASQQTFARPPLAL